MLDKLCPPALLYIAFSITQIIIDTFKGMYNTAFLKFIVMIIFSLVLNILCNRGLGIISWFIVFIPFIMMTIITTMLLFVFGLSPATGGLDYNVDYPQSNTNKTLVVKKTSNKNPMPPTADEVNNYNNVS
jgi:amino acid transporter